MTPTLIFRLVILSLLIESVSIQDDHGGTLCRIIGRIKDSSPIPWPETYCRPCLSYSRLAAVTQSRPSPEFFSATPIEKRDHPAAPGERRSQSAGIEGMDLQSDYHDVFELAER
jgi:hypothetical protein